MAQVDITGRNLVVITFLAAVGIIALKALMRLAPFPDIVKRNVDTI